MIASSIALRIRRGVTCGRCWIAVALAACVGPAAFGQDSGHEFEYCLVCHGPQARGNAAIGAPNLSVLESAYLRRQLEAYSAGWRGTHDSDPYGTEMQPMAALLDGRQLRLAAEYVSDLDPVWSEPTLTGDVDRGSDLYRPCAACHGSIGEGNEALGAPRLSGQSDWYLLRQIHAYRNGWRGTNPDDIAGMQMRALTETLDDDAARDLVAYLNTLVPENP
jgi:cytochrome c553